MYIYVEKMLDEITKNKVPPNCALFLSSIKNIVILMALSKVSDPGGFYQDLDPTFEKKRIRIRRGRVKKTGFLQFKWVLFL